MLDRDYPCLTPDARPYSAVWACSRPMCCSPRSAARSTCRWRSAKRALLSSSRSEEHTSELQSLMRISYAVFCLKKKKRKTNYKRSVQDRCNHVYTRLKYLNRLYSVTKALHNIKQTLDSIR